MNQHPDPKASKYLFPSSHSIKRGVFKIDPSSISPIDRLLDVDPVMANLNLDEYYDHGYEEDEDVGDDGHDAEDKLEERYD